MFFQFDGGTRKAVTDCRLFLLDASGHLDGMENEISQLERFKEAARELETDDDETNFNEKLGKLAKPKPDDKRDANKDE